MGKATTRSVTVGLVGWLLLLAWGTAEAQLRAASAEVVRIAGQVEVMPKGQQAWAPATVGARLVDGDQIRALQGASADLNLPDGSTILVAENTRFAVTKLQYDPQTRDRNAAFYVVTGKVRAQVSQTAVQLARQRQSNFTISTPGGVAAVRGTFIVVATRQNETLVFVFASPGQAASAARVTYVSRSGEQVTLTGGTFTRQVGTGTPSAAQPVSGLTGATQPTITGPGNPGPVTPDLAGFNVTIIQADQDVTLVQTAVGVTAASPSPLDSGTATTKTSGIGRDILSNPTAPPCTPSSSTTCP